MRFDRLVFGRKGNLFDLLLADASSTTSQQSHPTSALLSQVRIFYMNISSVFKFIFQNGIIVTKQAWIFD